MTPTVVVWLWGAAFLLAHLIVTHPPVRAPLVARLGPNGFQSAFSVLAAVLLGGMVWSWWGARHQGPMLWNLRGGMANHLVELWVVLSYALAGAGLAAPAPSLAGPPRKDPFKLEGAVAITRHPLMMGMAGWALGHLAMNGWASDIGFFGLFAATAIVGSAHQDWRKSAESPAYAAFREQTTFFPRPGLSALRRMSRAAWVGAVVGGALAVGVRTVHGWIIAL